MGSSVCGFVKGFCCRIRSANAIWAELWALRLRIKLSRKLKLERVVAFELDSATVVHMVHVGTTRNAFLKPLLQEVIMLLQLQD